VRISARLTEEALVVEVGDDGAGLRAEPGALIGEGHGLDNVRQRLATLYPGRAALELEPAPGGRGTVARIRLPAEAVAAAVPAARRSFGATR